MSCICYTQTAKYSWPIDSTYAITGNYGELRPNHFHAGIDISTNGKINVPIYAIADGYVSRIKVGSVGYGKAIYMTHTDGNVSVFAHLTSYASVIFNVVKKEQYSKQHYEVELLLKKGELKIKKGDLIGYSGNTGSSTGPHIHFEIRDEKTEVPLNPFQFYKISDTIKPNLQAIALYSLADTCFPKFLRSVRTKKSKNNLYNLLQDTILINQSILGVAFAGYDQLRYKGSSNVINGASLYLDGKLIYTHSLNNIAFDEQRYVNEFSETIGQFTYQKCFLPTLYPTAIYKNCFNKGRIVLSDTNYHTIKLFVYDEHLNEQIIHCVIKTRSLTYYEKPSIKSDVFVNCNEDLMIAKNKLQIFIPAKTLYHSSGLIFENTLETTGKLIILPSELNLSSTAIIGFQVPKKLLRNKTKLVLKSGSSILNPINKNDSVFYSVRNFGWFQLVQDTIAPKVKTQLSANKIKRLKGMNSFSFIIQDNLSGIAKYNLFLNNKWVLAEYDTKSNLLTYFFDEDTPIGNLSFKLLVEDKVGNVATFFYLQER
jgi:hypothetical protein